MPPKTMRAVVLKGDYKVRPLPPPASPFVPLPSPPPPSPTTPTAPSRFLLTKPLWKGSGRGPSLPRHPEAYRRCTQSDEHSVVRE